MRRAILSAVVSAITVLMLGGTATSSVPQAQCQPFQAGDSPSSALDVGWVSRFTYAVPQNGSAVSGTTTVDGSPGWAVFFDNHSGSTVTNPRVTISSGLDPSVFDGGVPSFPFACSLPSLDPNQELQILPDLEATGAHSSFSLGYDASRTVSPAEVPASGGDVTVQFTVKLTDLRYAGGAYVYLSLDHGNGVSIISQTSPANLDQGESASPPPNSVQNPSPNDGVFALSNAQLDKPYVFSAVVHVDNPSGEAGGGPWTWTPGAQIYVSGQGRNCSVVCNASGPSVSFADPSLDGATPGSGSVSVAVDQTDRHWTVNTNTQYVTTYRGGLFPDLNADVESGAAVGVPATTNSVAHGANLGGHPLLDWDFAINDFRPGNTVTNPAISVGSGYGSAQLFPDFGGPASSLPVVRSQPSLPPGANLRLGLGSSIAGTVVPGCDTGRSVEPATVPVGGGDQTFTFSVTCTDPAVRNVNGGVQQFLSGSTVVSFTPPSNLDQGEALNAPPGSWFGAPGDASAGFGIGIENVVPGKQYTFAFVVHSPNPFGTPYAQTANMGLQEDSPQPTGCTGCGGPRTSITIAEPTLDGSTPGAGQVTFSTSEPHVWGIEVHHTQRVNYEGTQQVALDYDGPPAATDGQSVTLTASWEGIEFPSATPVVFTLGSQSCTATTGSLPNPFGDQGAVCSIVLSQPMGSYALQVSSPGDVSVYPASTSAAFSITGPTSTGQCKNGDWRAFRIFKNQGDCVSYVATKGKNTPAGER